MKLIEMLELPLLVAAFTPAFWIAALLAAFLFWILRRRLHKRLAWVTLIGVPLVVLLSLICWLLFDLNDLLFNLASPLTHKVRVYPVECKGKVIPGNLCCGKLDIPLNPTTFAISVSRQQVFRSAGGSFGGPLHNCEVQDYLNWQCVTYWDKAGTHEVNAATAASSDWYVMSKGKFSESFEPDPDPLKQKLLEAMRTSVWVDAMQWWLGHRWGHFEAHKGIWDDKEWNRYARGLDDPICRSFAGGK